MNKEKQNTTEYIEDSIDATTRKRSTQVVREQSNIVVSYRKKKKSKVQMILSSLFMLALICVVGTIALYIFSPDRYEGVRSVFANMINDPVRDVIYALETEDHIVALVWQPV